MGSGGHFNAGEYAAQQNKQFKVNQKQNGKASGGSSSGGSGGGSSSGSGGGSSTTTSYVYTTRPEAKYEIRQAMREAIGRNPRAGEMRRFIKALKRFEQANPQVTSGDGDSSVTTGGVSAAAREQFTYQWLRKTPNRRARMDAKTIGTEYLDAFAKALDAPVDLTRG